MPNPTQSNQRWLNRTVLGVGLASLFSDWAHETASAILPAFLGTIGAGAAWLGLIEGVSDGIASFAKMASGVFTDKLERRKPIAVIGYLVTALGTASFALATNAWHILIARSCAWLGRGVRTPVRKALLAAAVSRETYGRAFGFERMMDTVGAIIGPATSFALLALAHHHYPTVFALTLIPGLMAALVIATLVQEKERKPVSHITFSQRLQSLSASYRKFLIAVGIFGCGAFAHTMLILLAVQKLAPSLGHAKAASVAVLLYILHNIINAACAPIAGWCGDHFAKRGILAFAYFLAAAMALCVIILPGSFAALALIFSLAGASAAFGETLEDSFCAELVSDYQHGIAFGALATVNGIGDFVSSILVGVLWTSFNVTAAFGFSATLSLISTYQDTLIFKLQPLFCRLILNSWPSLPTR